MNEANLTPRLKQLLVKARKRAADLKNNYVGTEHVFLTWLDASASHSTDVLKKTGVSFDKIKEIIYKAILPTKESEADITQVIDFNNELNDAIKEAKTVAQNLGQEYIGVEHFIVTILSQDKSLVYKTLTDLSVTVADVKKTLSDTLASKAQELTKIPAGGGKAEESEAKGGDSVLKKFSIELVERASKGELDPVIGRDKEINRTIRILARKKKNNPVLVGNAGVGKTSIVEGLALRIHEKTVPLSLHDKRIFALDLGRLVAGTMYRGQFEERLKKIMEEVRGNKNFIVFIDELHTVVGAGGAEGSMDASNMIKPALARGDFNCIGATTVEEYRKYIEKDAALERRFQGVDVAEPSIADTILIMKGAAKSYEKFHGVKYPSEVLEAIVTLSSRYITDRFQPDKSFDVIDEIGAAVKLANVKSTGDRADTEKKLVEIKALKAQVIKEERYEDAQKLKEEEDRLEFALNKMKEAEKSKKLTAKLTDVYDIISSWTGVPVGDMTPSEKDHILTLGDTLKDVVVGQNDAVDAVAKCLKKYKTPLKDQSRPIGGFLFVGPTGVGKTLLAQTVAAKHFGTQDCFLELDMSEYTDSISVNKLIGAPSGYVGYEESGILVKFVQQHPYAVLLFDEIEKAHYQVRQLLLQILDKGVLTDSKGKEVNFKNTLVIATTNEGMEQAKQSMGFGTADSIKKSTQDNLIAQLKKTFSSELVGRFEVVSFNKLTKEHARDIVALEISKLNTRLEESKTKLTYSTEVLDLLLSKGFDESSGARHVRREVEHTIEDMLTDEFLKDNIPESSVIILRVENNSLKYEIKKEKYGHTTIHLPSLATT